MTEYAPAKIISNDTVKLSRLLKHFEPSAPADWRRGGKFLLSYLELVVEYPDPNATLGPNSEKFLVVKNLLELLSCDLLNHWKLQASQITHRLRQLLVIFFKEAAMYLSTLQQSLGPEKVQLCFILDFVRCLVQFTFTC